ECSVVGHADDASFDVRANRITMLGIEPGIGCELFESERNTLLIGIKFQNFNLNLVPDVDQVAGMSQAPPGHVGDVEQAVDAAKVNERAVVGEVLHDTGED